MTDNYEAILNDPAALISKSREFQAQYMHDLALLLAENVYNITSDFNFTKQADDIISISGFYSKLPEKKLAGKAACEKIALNRKLSWHERDVARKNSIWYSTSLKDLCPSTDVRKIEFVPRYNYSAMNPSITVTKDGKIMMIQRTVNYLIRDDGSYDMRGDSAIRTINYLLEFDNEYNIISKREILPPANLPDPKYGLVIGWEDCRLFSWKNELWCTSTVRELTEDGWCNIVLSRIENVDDNYCRFADYRIIEPTFKEKQHEKNWMPLVKNDNLYFLYSCDPVRVIDHYGNLVSQRESSIASDSFRGGGNLVEFYGNWLAIIHESHVMSDNRRTYMHRFVVYDNDGNLIKYSPAFYFIQTGVEFAAGLAINPVANQVIVSFGFKDNESYISILDPSDILKILTQVPQLGEPSLSLQYQDNYIANMHNVVGWLEYDTANMISYLMNYQSTNNIYGNVMEIGTYHGKLFCLLANGCLSSESAIGIDIFDNQEANQDNSGEKFDRSILENNLQKFASNSKYEILKADSTTLGDEFTNKYRGVRFMSVDGSHTWKATLHDLKLAENLLVSGGIVAVDDILRIDWIGVTNGIYAYLHGNTNQPQSLVPFAIIPNKLLLTTDRGFAKKYQDLLLENFPHLRAINNQEWQEFWYDSRILVLKN